MLKFLKVASYLLVIIGAINWGLVGVFHFNLVTHFFGEMTKLTRLIYAIIGLSAIVSIITEYTCCSKRMDL